MSEVTITGSREIILKRQEVCTLSQFDGERYLLNVRAGSTLWQMHLDQDGVEQLCSLFMPFQRTTAEQAA